MFLAIIILAFSLIVLFYSAQKITELIVRIANYFRIREFVTSFFLLAFASSLPNLWIGIISALKGTSLLSLGDVTGNTLMVLTLGIGLASLFSSQGISTKSRTIKITSLFTLFSTLLILILMLDKYFSRGDALLLILMLVGYFVWLFSRKERYSLNHLEVNNQQKNYSKAQLIEKEIKSFQAFLKEAFGVFFWGVLLAFSAYGVVYSSQIIGNYFGLSFFIIGILITGIGNALPESSVAILSAKKNQNWIILGDSLGSIFLLNTLILPLVTLVNPIDLSSSNFSPILFSRIFIIVLCLLFYILSRTGEILTKKEGVFLSLFYIIFLYFIFQHIF
ncbi:MAG: sodium:calcium antiporter [Candidatus Paceibacterota bacterium]